MRVVLQVAKFTGVSLVVLFIVGMATSRLTGQRLVRGGVRLLVVGGAAGALAYLIGKLLGVTV